MRKEAIILILGILFVSIAAVGIASAIEGTCTQLAWQCDGPSGKTTYTSCGVDICAACPAGTLAHTQKCGGSSQNNPGNTITYTTQPSSSGYTGPHSLGDFIGLIFDGFRNLFRNIFGLPSIVNGQVQSAVPTGAERLVSAFAGVVLIIVFMLIVKTIFVKAAASAAARGVSRARPSYRNSKIPKKRKKDLPCVRTRRGPKKGFFKKF